MTKNTIKVFLIHGDSDYLVYKDLKETKSKLIASNTGITEFFGAKSTDFQAIHGSLQSDDLFQESSSVIIRDISDGKSFFPFIEELTECISKTDSFVNYLYIYQFGKVLKTSKLYKAILKKGEIREMTQPKPDEILSVIKKSLAITDEAARLLLDYSGGNLFQIKNEIKKLQNLILARKKSKVGIEDIDEICIKSLSQNEVWGIGNKFLTAKLETGNMVAKKALIDSIEDLLANNVAVMQILYSFYQYTLSSIKMKRMISAGKSYRDCMALGYFFVKEFFDKRDKMKPNELFELNSKLLQFEERVKTGEIDEVVGLRQLVLSL